MQYTHILLVSVIFAWHLCCTYFAIAFIDLEFWSMNLPDWNTEVQRCCRNFYNVCAKYKLQYELREEQKAVLDHVVHGRDCMCVLPTGYGKTDTFMLAPALKDEVFHMNT